MGMGNADTILLTLSKKGPKKPTMLAYLAGFSSVEAMDAFIKPLLSEKKITFKDGIYTIADFSIVK